MKSLINRGTGSKKNVRQKNMKKEELKIRDRRNKGWFFLDNEYLNGYAKIFGAIGTAVYVSLCRHADNETQKCFPSIDLIAKELNVSRPTVIKYIKLLEEHNLIEIDKGKRNSKQQWLNNEYTLLDKSEWFKTTENETKEAWLSVSETTTQGTDPSKTITHGFNKSQVKPFSNPSKTDSSTQVKPFNTKDTHTKDTHIKDTHTSNEQSSLPTDDNKNSKNSEKKEKNQVNTLIDLFQDVNPSYQKFYPNKGQRKALQEMIDNPQIGFKKTQEIIKKLPSINTQKYAPTVTTPFVLEKKYADIVAFLAKQESSSVGIKPKIHYN